MDFSLVVMWLGFALASYSVVGNDVIQTLGTFLTSNEDKVKWQVLWAYAASILVAVLLFGFFTTDISYGRLSKFEMPEIYHWYYLLPPIVLLTITRWGIPVSTTFLILTLFSMHEMPADLTLMVQSLFDTEQVLGGMVQKSVVGYVVAFFAGAIFYLIVTKFTENYFLHNPVTNRAKPFWTVAQWFSTAFLWSQWLMQDLANIYIYLRGGQGMPVWQLFLSVGILVAMLGYIFYSKGGVIQDVVRKKTNTADIRAATFIDLIYGIILYIFKDLSDLPMSTTWVFIGLLAGREIGIHLLLEGKVKHKISRMIFADLGKVFFGLIVSVLLVFLIKMIGG